jgi:hypothetical protein
VENDGPNTPAGDEEVEPTANVVHFPGDWFGPRDELVPFGPRVSEAGSRVEDEPGVAEPTPVRAEDFWGEQSWSMHDAMAGPGAVEPVAEAEAPVRRRVGVWRGWLSGVHLPRVRVRVPRVRVTRVRVPSVRVTRVRVPRVRAAKLGRRPAMVVAGSAFACLVVASVVGSVWSGAVPAPRGGHDAAVLSPAVIAPGVPPITTARIRRRPASRRSALLRRGSTSHASHAHARVNKKSGARGTPEATVASVSPSRSSATPRSGSSDQSSSASSSGTGATSGSGATNSSGGRGGTGGSGGTSRSSGPVGPGAPFGPGHLG